VHLEYKEVAEDRELPHLEHKKVAARFHIYSSSAVVKMLTVDEQQVRLHVWDTAGQKHVHSLIPSYIHNSTIAVFVYNITLQSTFDNLKQWQKMTVDSATPVLVIVGNKVDLENSRAVETYKAKNDADLIQVQYFETSAVTPLKIRELFQAIAAMPTGGQRPAPVPAESTPEFVQQPPVKDDVDTATPSKPSAGCGCESIGIRK
jgi:small GTP-binding protein